MKLNLCLRFSKEVTPAGNTRDREIQRMRRHVENVKGVNQDSNLETTESENLISGFLKI